MNTLFRRRFCISLMAFAVPCRVALAERHIQDVLHHTEAAVEAAGDSKAIGQHASDALELMDEAEAANALRPDVLEYLQRGEAELGSALRNAQRFNSTSAWQDATDAQRYLEAAEQAANGQPPR
jgi:hypothetical protein